MDAVLNVTKRDAVVVACGSGVVAVLCVIKVVVVDTLIVDGYLR
jgi:hypothetical protein